MRTTRVVRMLVLATAGCDAAVPPPATEPAATRVSPASTTQISTGCLAGRVTWAGPAPTADPLTAFRFAADGAMTVLTRRAPNLPLVGPDAGVGGSVIFLRGVDPAIAKPWDHPPVTVEMHDERPMVRQGDRPAASVGFVHRGDSVSLVSRQLLFHSLRARGAAFWTLTLPDPDRPRTRRLDRPGLVELSSGANYFWMRGYLWVCEHPYFTSTDAAGRWSLTGVPAGEYDLVAWLPNWRVERTERDPESGQVARLVFKPPLDVVRRVMVRDGEAFTVGDVEMQEPRTK